LPEADTGAIDEDGSGMQQKRFADWFEKMSAAFMVGAVLADKSAIVALFFGLFCLYVSMKLTERGPLCAFPEL
jgi:hypothetical protein